MRNSGAYVGRWVGIVVLISVLSACKIGLYSQLNEQEANEMLVVLASEGIHASKELIDEKGWQVTVSESELGSALDVLRARGLPRDRHANMGAIFEKQGLVTTPAEERMRYIYAVSQELSETLSKVDGVISARVHVVIPANDPLSDKVQPSSAAVFIKHSPDVDLRLLVPTVKEMVAHSIEGLTHDKVALSLFEAHKLPPTLSTARRNNNLLGVLPTETWVMLIVLFAVATGAFLLLPGFFRKRGKGWKGLLRKPDSRS